MNLQPLLPALDNLPVFLVIAVLLAGLLVLSLAAIGLRFLACAASASLSRAKYLVALPTWVVFSFWLVIGAGVAAFAGGVGGSLVIALLPIGSGLALLLLLAVLLVAWVRARAWADWALVVIVTGFCTAVLWQQRLWFCEPLAWAGLTRAQACTAGLYAAGEQGAIRHIGTASEWYGLAAVNGSEAAVTALVSIEPSRLTRERLLLAAAEAGNRVAMWELFRLLGAPEGLPWLHAAVEREYPEAILELAAQNERRARKTPSYQAEARQSLIRAAETGSAEARFTLAFYYFRKPDATPEEMARARNWLTAAADQRNRYALSNIAHYLTNGQYGFEVDLTRARGYAEALIEVLDETGRGSARDRRLAGERLASIEERLAREAAGTPALDRVEKQYRAAFGTLTRPRTDEEEGRAYALMQDAAEKRHRGAMVFMGRVYLRGVPKHGIDRDPAMARQLLEESLEGLEGDTVYQRRNGSVTVMTTRDGVEKLLAGLPAEKRRAGLNH